MIELRGFLSQFSANIHEIVHTLMRLHWIVLEGISEGNGFIVLEGISEGNGFIEGDILAYLLCVEYFNYTIFFHDIFRVVTH